MKSGDLVIRKGKHKVPPPYVRALPIHAKNGRDRVPEGGGRPLYGRRDDDDGAGNRRDRRHRATSPGSESQELITEESSREFPEAAFTLHAFSGSLDCAVACAPAALEMTEG
jgi:hypothetical protein